MNDNDREVIVGADDIEVDITLHDPTPTAQFVPVSLTALVVEGVMMAANERFFWPLGLALTWFNDESDLATKLHVRQWEYADGHHETIMLEDGDLIAPVRRANFEKWLIARIESLPPAERGPAIRLLNRPRGGELSVT